MLDVVERGAMERDGGDLRTAVEAFRSGSLADRPDARIEEEFAELHRVGELVEAERLRRLAEIDRRGLFARDGHLSAASWLASRFGVAWGVARAHVGLARSLRRMRGVREAFEAGELSVGAVRVLSSAEEIDPEAFRRDEAPLLRAARTSPIADLRRVVGTWREAVEREHAARGEDPRWTGRRLHASVTLGGTVRIDGDLDPVTGETFLTALRAVVDADARSGADPGRTPAQSRVDALGEICRQWLDAPERSSVAGERPHVTLTLGLESLAGLAPGPAELEHAGSVPEHIARQLACDASLMRVVMAGRSEPLDVGRRTPVVPPSLRRAVILRDRHCRFPGCDRPHAWCDAHHIDHWADGGPTTLTNLLLLCRRHHGMVHRDGGFGLSLVEGRPVFRRPDGSILDERAPP